MKKQLLFSILCLTLSANAVAVCNNNIQASTPDSRFTTTPDTVSDNITGLMWMRCSLGQSGGGCSTGSAATYTWETALHSPAAANAVNTYGYGDWRLPNSKELASIVEVKCYDPAINANIFPNTPSGFYWSSSPYADSNNYAWGVYFYDGNDSSDNKVNSYFVRLVRGGQ